MGSRWAELLALVLLVLGQVRQCQAVGVVLTQKDVEEDWSSWDEQQNRASSLDGGEAAELAEAIEVLEQDGRGFEEIKQLVEKDVVVLGSGNFSEFVKSNVYVLVKFYAPWCGHCQALAPEYAEAATFLKGDAVLAKVDATANTELAEEYGIESFPTLLFFIKGVDKAFFGGRKKEEIVAWVKRKTGPSVFHLSSKRDAEKVFDSLNSTMAIALLNSLEGSEMEEYSSAAREVDGVYFFGTEIVEAAEVFSFPKNVTRPAVVLLKQESEKVSWFDGPFQRDAIEEFVRLSRLPLVTTFNKENAVLIFESPIKKQVIVLAAAADYEELIPDLEEASKSLMGRLVFVYVDLDDSEQAPDILDFFGISGDKPAIMGYESEEDGQKFLLEGEISAKTIKAFGENFVSGSLEPYIKSAPIPETNDGDVKIVVGLNLESIVLDETKDVFLEIYAPWCGHCQALEPIWEKLGERVRDVESIIIAKMDGTTNEHAKVKAESYPTLLLFPAGTDVVEPTPFEGERTIDDFVKFLEKEASIPFTVSRNPDASPTLESVDDKSFDSEKDEL